MERRIHRNMVLSADEVRLALYWYLKNEHDMPMPENPENLTITSDGINTGVSWECSDLIELSSP